MYRFFLFNLDFERKYSYIFQLTPYIRLQLLTTSLFIASIDKGVRLISLKITKLFKISHICPRVYKLSEGYIKSIIQYMNIYEAFPNSVDWIICRFLTDFWQMMTHTESLNEYKEKWNIITKIKTTLSKI